MRTTVLVYKEVLGRIIKFKPESQKLIESMIVSNNNLDYHNVDVNIIEFLSKELNIPFGYFLLEKYPFQNLSISVKDGDYVLFSDAIYLGIYKIKEKLDCFSLIRCGKEYDLSGDNLEIPSFRPINDIGDELWYEWDRIPNNLSRDECLFGDNNNYKYINDMMPIYPKNELTELEERKIYEYSLDRPLHLKPMNFGDISLYFDLSSPFGSFTMNEVNILVDYIKSHEKSGKIKPELIYESNGIKYYGYYIMKSSRDVSSWIKNFQ